MVLLRICFWIGIAQKSGRDWTAQSMMALIEETAFSFDQVKRAVAKLRKLGLITTEQHLFHDKDGPKNMNHYRLTEGGFALCFEGAEKGKPAVPEQCKSAPLYIQQGESTGSNNKENIASALCASAGQTSKEIQEGDSGENMKLENLTSGHDVPNMLEAPMLPHKPKKTHSLVTVWMTKFTEVTDKYCPPMTAKQLGQLKQFEKRCPKHLAETILCNVLENWHTFCKDVEMNQGLKKTPYEPSVGFLLQYVQNAVSVGLPKPKPVNKVPMPTLKPNPVQLIACEPPAPEDDFATKGEYLAFLNDVPAKG
jgi:hypothetical protein